jgi:hypothetical protein
MDHPPTLSRERKGSERFSDSTTLNVGTVIAPAGGGVDSHASIMISI